MINCPAPSYLFHTSSRLSKKLSTTVSETIQRRVVGWIETNGGSGIFWDGKRLFVSRINEGTKQGTLRAAIKSLSDLEKNLGTAHWWVKVEYVEMSVERITPFTLLLSFSSLLFLHWHKGNPFSYSYSRATTLHDNYSRGVRCSYVQPKNLFKVRVAVSYTFVHVRMYADTKITRKEGSTVVAGVLAVR